MAMSTSGFRDALRGGARVRKRKASGPKVRKGKRGRKIKAGIKY